MWICDNSCAKDITYLCQNKSQLLKVEIRSKRKNFEKERLNYGTQMGNFGGYSHLRYSSFISKN